MSTIPEDVLTAADLFEWYRLQDELARIKRSESLLRMRIFRHLFPLPTEGTNSLDLDTLPLLSGLAPTGNVIKAVHKIQRDIDVAALTTLTPKFQENNLPLPKLVKYTPELVLKEYRKLTTEEAQLFDQALIVKPGSPSIDIVLPASAKKAQS